ncbi:MAG: hypothetical protein NZ523_08400, partial [Elioraea sp.]|nr:hypothetical protein [Elioraea sp.]
MRRQALGMVAPFALLSLAGCATMIRGTEQQVSINTIPVGAQVQLSNGMSCVSPCTLTVPRNQSLTMTITREGCAPQTASMVP